MRPRIRAAFAAFAACVVLPAIPACATDDGEDVSASEDALDMTKANKVTIDSDKVLVINGKKLFPIGFSAGPQPGAKAPNGKDGLVELRSAGATFLRTGKTEWTAETFAEEQKWEDAAAKAGMYCWPNLGNAASILKDDGPNAKLQAEIVKRFAGHPGLGAWKGVDEPNLSNMPTGSVINAYQELKKRDPNHPNIIIMGPRGSAQEMRTYGPGADVIGMDIYPVAEQYGLQTDRANKTISVVGDLTKTLTQQVNDNSKRATWMTLQIGWSGVLPPHKLVFPTLRQERFMAYDAIINGARGLFFFGGNLPATWRTADDKKYEWNWSFWNAVLRPVVEEIGDKSALHAALVAPNSKLKIRATGATGIEFAVREVGQKVYVIAAKKTAGKATVTFRDLPADVTAGKVMFEKGAAVTIANATFSDVFDAHDVHVYELARTTAPPPPTTADAGPTDTDGGGVMPSSTNPDPTDPQDQADPAEPNGGVVESLASGDDGSGDEGESAGPDKDPTNTGSATQSAGCSVTTNRGHGGLALAALFVTAFGTLRRRRRAASRA